MAGIRFFMEPQRERLFGDIGAAFMSIGTELDHPARMYELHNFTDVTLQFSIDGIDKSFPMASGQSKIVDIASNETTTDGWYLGKGTSFYVRIFDGAGAPALGGVYLCIAYGA